MDDVAFYGSAQRSAHILKTLLDRGPDQGYSPNLTKSLFIAATSNQEEVANWEFEAEGLHIKFFGNSRYLWAYLGPWEELLAWVQLQGKNH